MQDRLLEMSGTQEKGFMLCELEHKRRGLKHGEEEIFTKTKTNSFPLMKDIHPDLRNPLNHKQDKSKQNHTFNVVETKLP